MEQKHHLLELVEYTGLSINKLESEAELGQGVLSKIIKDSTGKRQISTDSVIKLKQYILDRFQKKLDEDWVRTGNGTMFVQVDEEDEQEKSFFEEISAKVMLWRMNLSDNKREKTKNEFDDIIKTLKAYKRKLDAESDAMEKEMEDNPL